MSKPTVCCCDALQFDGSCYNKQQELIATCYDSLTEPIAKCVEGRVEGLSDGSDAIETIDSTIMNSKLRKVECYTSYSECPVGTLVQESEVAIDEWIFFFFGVLFLVVSLLFFLRIVAKFRQSSARKTSFDYCSGLKRLFCYTDENQKRQTNVSLRTLSMKERQRNRSFAMRSLGTSGLQFLVLGGIVKYYHTTVIVVGVCQGVHLLFVILRTFQMIPSENAEKKEKAPENNKYSHWKAAISVVNPVICGIDYDEGENHESLVLEPSDIYDDISAPLMRVTLLFICQALLLILYIIAIYNKKSPDWTTYSPYGFFIVGVLVQICYQEAKDKHPAFVLAQKKKHWTKAFGALNKGKVEFKTMANETEHIPKASMIARLFMSNLINCQGTFMLMFLLPLHLSHSDDIIGFVLDATAAYIIVELDDVIDHEEDKIELIDEEGENKSPKNKPIADASMSKDEILKYIDSVVDERLTSMKSDETASLLDSKDSPDLEAASLQISARGKS